MGRIVAFTPMGDGGGQGLIVVLKSIAAVS